MFFSGNGRPISTKLGMQHQVLQYFNVFINNDTVLTLAYNNDTVLTLAYIFSNVNVAGVYIGMVKKFYKCHFNGNGQTYKC